MKVYTEGGGRYPPLRIPNAHDRGTEAQRAGAAIVCIFWAARALIARTTTTGTCAN